MFCISFQGLGQVSFRSQVHVFRSSDLIESRHEMCFFKFHLGERHNFLPEAQDNYQVIILRVEKSGRSL